MRPRRNTHMRSVIRKIWSRLWLITSTLRPRRRKSQDDIFHGFGLRHTQRGGGLVHDNEFRPPGTRASDCHDLSLTARERFNGFVDRRHVRYELLQHLSCVRQHGALVEHVHELRADRSIRGQDRRWPRRSGFRRAQGLDTQSRCRARAPPPATRNRQRAPSNSIVPASARSTPLMILTRVDFPAPLSPTSPVISPRARAIETSCSATTGPKLLLMACARSTASGILTSLTTVTLSETSLSRLASAIAYKASSWESDQSSEICPAVPLPQVLPSNLRPTLEDPNRPRDQDRD